MMRIFSFALLCCLIFRTANGADNDLKANQSRIADAIEKIPASKIKLFLYSLDPKDQRFSGKPPENSDKVFHNYPIIGSVEIIPTREKESLLGAFAKGVRGFHWPSNCILEPRHGLRVVSDLGTNDFAICFKCGDVAAYGFGPAESFTIGNSRAVFDKFLDEYKIKKAE
jgi:hypothetical protein